jgi:stalled ribosome alternative rescue factor ArfA
MAVTLDAKGRAKLKQGSGRKAKPKRTVKRRSAAAAALADPRYRKRVVKTVKAYRRKGKAPPQGEEDE